MLVTVIIFLRNWLIVVYGHERTYLRTNGKLTLFLCLFFDERNKVALILIAHLHVMSNDSVPQNLIKDMILGLRR